MAAGRREHGTLRGGGEDFSFTKVQTVDGLNRLEKKWRGSGAGVGLLGTRLAAE